MDMKKLKMTVAALFTVAFLTAFVGDQPLNQWNLDKAHTSITFEVNHFFTGVDGRFDDFEIDLNFDPDNPTGGSVEAVVQIGSVNTANSRRDDDLRSDSFFDATTYPTMEFVSSSIKETGKNKFEAMGKLTIKDKTQDVSIPFEVLGVMDHPRREGTQIIGLRAGFTLNRTEYGVGTGDWMRTSVVGDEVRIKINLEANRKT